VSIHPTSSANPIHMDTCEYGESALSMIIPLVDTPTASSTIVVVGSHRTSHTSPLVPAGAMAAGSMLVFFPTLIHAGVAARGVARPSAFLFAGWRHRRGATPHTHVPPGVVVYTASDYNNCAGEHST
jgi:ectoine hydroxylase-related dioxygenase (phytanoyl-CoA dioxygenase family)